jgi:hypothetical protein
MVHMDMQAVPPNAWQTVYGWLGRQAMGVESPDGRMGTLHVARSHRVAITTFMIAGRTFDDRPPARIDVHLVPTTKNANLPCGHPAKTCKTGSTECEICRFTFCDYHSPRHVRTLVLPWPTWKDIITQFRQQMRKCAKRGKGLVKVRSPPFLPEVL